MTGMVKYIKPGPGQESVWSYPRPPRVDPSGRLVEVHFAGEKIAATRNAKRVLETSHPPVYYIPPQDILSGSLIRSHRTSWCEFKGGARYHDVRVGDRIAPAAAWSYPDPDPGFESIKDYVALLSGAALLWWLAALVYARIAEEPGETAGGGNAFVKAFESLALLGRDRPFRRFVVTRALLISSALVAPYYVSLAQRSSGGSTSTLGMLILAGGLASSVSAPTWGRMADRSSRRV